MINLIAKTIFALFSFSAHETFHCIRTHGDVLFMHCQSVNNLEPWCMDKDTIYRVHYVLLEVLYSIICSQINSLILQVCIYIYERLYICPLRHSCYVTDIPGSVAIHE